MPDYPHPSTLHTEAEIVAVRDTLPKVRNGDALQPYKAQLNRRLHTIRARGELPLTQAEMASIVAAAPSGSVFTKVSANTREINLRIVWPPTP